MKKEDGISLIALILIIAIIVIASVCIYLVIKNGNVNEEETIKTEVFTAEKPEILSENEYAVKDNNFSKFDFSFLKFENEKVNKIYSPLSIKYAFKMLEEATTGDAYNQISSIINAYNLTKYQSNANMALANAFFVRDSYQENVKKSYMDVLRTKYDADIEFDSFSNATKINSWVKEHTLNLIPTLLDDSDVEELDFALVNALGIDMEWNHKFLKYYYEDDKNITSSVEYSHARIPDETWGFAWITDETLYKKKFDNDQVVSSMKVYASLNNYDTVKELGEEYIRETVYADFKEWVLKNQEYESYTFNNDFSEENIKNVFDAWFEKDSTPGSSYEGDGYIASLNKNYGRVDYSTDFSVYVDDNVKVFAKDLKEYDGTTLQYIGIMPINEELDEYITHTEHTEILDLISNLKELKKENFKDGYLTYIHGYIPKFNFEYELVLQNDLEKMGVTDVFEQGKANLTNMTDDNSVYITTAKHKANIEFTQDGIKAAAATMAGGAGAGEWYDYFFEMPTEEIDITFDKPYMFLIRDKETGETWFVGTVYEPLDANDETAEDIYTAWEDREDDM